jgi:hypothetical protein
MQSEDQKKTKEEPTEGAKNKQADKPEKPEYKPGQAGFPPQSMNAPKEESSE